MSLNNLPIELYPYILKYLNLTDLIECKRVCKNLRIGCDLMEVNELIISDRKTDQTDNWSFRNESVNYENADPISLEIKKISSILKLEDRLKRLHINEKIDQNFIQILNQFKQLEQLEINWLIFDFNSNVKLNLANLKILKLLQAQSWSKESKIILQTPKLNMIQCNKLGSIKFAYPQLITHLKYHNHFFVDPNFYLNLMLLNNLEYLAIYLKTMKAIKNDLNKFSKLKVLNIDDLLKPTDRIYRYCYSEKRANHIETIKESLSVLSLKRDDLNIHYNDSFLFHYHDN